MLHACAARFDVTGNLEIFFEIRDEVNKALLLVYICCSILVIDDYVGLMT